MTEKPPYLGHRDRVRKKVEKYGFDVLDSYELLELLLFYVLPRCDTYTISKRLLASFDGISGVFNASADQLMKIEGIGESTAQFLTCFLPSFKAYKSDLEAPKKVLSKISDILCFLRTQTFGIKEEAFFIMLFNIKHELIQFKKVSDGNCRAITVKISDIVKSALLHDATCVIIAHNHLSGKIYPSNDDIKSTISIKEALQAVCIRFTDSIIFDDKSYFSFRERQSSFENSVFSEEDNESVKYYNKFLGKLV